jgi:hypothetical protein
VRPGWIREHSGLIDGAAGLVLAGIMLLLLARRDELPLPPRITPPQVGVDVVAGSSGVETTGSESFWTFVEPTAEIKIFNATDVERVVEVSFRLTPGPCLINRTLHVNSPSEDRFIDLSSESSLDVALADVVLRPLSSAIATITSSGEPCPPVGVDPRAIFIQIFSLRADETPPG